MSFTVIYPLPVIHQARYMEGLLNAVLLTDDEIGDIIVPTEAPVRGS